MRARSMVLAMFAAACYAKGGAPLETRAPELYGRGIFTSDAWDFFMAWSPDEREVFFCHATDDFSSFEIFATRVGKDGRWSAPVHPRFATRWSNSDPHVTRDGKRVFFISDRPLPGDTGQAARKTYDIWYADRDGRGQWSDAIHLEGPMNLPEGNEWSPSIAVNGNIYFGTLLPGGRGDQDIWVSRYVNGTYLPPENLGDSVNTAGGEIEPWIAPDESYIIVSGARRKDAVGSYDLYIAERRAGVWQKARLLPQPINTPLVEFNPSVTPDGRWLYFSSTRTDGKTGDIYRIPMSVVRQPAR